LAGIHDLLSFSDSNPKIFIKILQLTTFRLLYKALMKTTV